MTVPDEEGPRVLVLQQGDGWGRQEKCSQWLAEPHVATPRLCQPAPQAPVLTAGAVLGIWAQNFRINREGTDNIKSTSPWAQSRESPASETLSSESTLRWEEAVRAPTGRLDWAKLRQSPGGWERWAGWLLTLVTGQVWLVPELGCILDKLDVALALLQGRL